MKKQTTKETSQEEVKSKTIPNIIYASGEYPKFKFSKRKNEGSTAFISIQHLLDILNENILTQERHATESQSTKNYDGLCASQIRANVLRELAEKVQKYI